MKTVYDFITLDFKSEDGLFSEKCEILLPLGVEVLDFESVFGGQIQMHLLYPESYTLGADRRTFFEKDKKTAKLCKKIYRLFRKEARIVFQEGERTMGRENLKFIKILNNIALFEELL